MHFWDVMCPTLYDKDTSCSISCCNQFKLFPNDNTVFWRKISRSAICGWFLNCKHLQRTALLVLSCIYLTSTTLYSKSTFFHCTVLTSQVPQLPKWVGEPYHVLCIPHKHCTAGSGTLQHLSDNRTMPSPAPQKHPQSNHHQQQHHHHIIIIMIIRIRIRIIGWQMTIYIPRKPKPRRDWAPPSTMVSLHLIVIKYAVLSHFHD